MSQMSQIALLKTVRRCQSLPTYFSTSLITEHLTTTAGQRDTM